MIVGITGASGFVGTNLKAYFAKFGDIVVKEINRQSIGTGLVIDDDKIDIVIHLAGKAHDLRTNVDNDEYYKSNFELTKQLYDCFLASKASGFIFVSSVKAAADKVDGALTEEQDPTPETPYGKSKLLAEQYIQGKALPANKSFYILRPCMIHGPGNKGNMNLLYKFVEKGIPYPLAGFHNRRSFLSIENLCFVMKELIKDNEIPSGVYNVADDEPLSTNQVVSVMAASLKIKEKQLKFRPAIIQFLARLGDKLHLPLTTERLRKLTEDYIVSNVKIKKALKKDLPVTSLEGLRITFDSFKKMK
jgi:nucleoside-diphosphate-sugar epimerase